MKDKKFTITVRVFHSTAQDPKEYECVVYAMTSERARARAQRMMYQKYSPELVGDAVVDNVEE